MNFFVALQFLTVIPIPWRLKASPDNLGRSVVYFPIVGLAIGLILAGFNWLFSLFLPVPVVNALLLVVLVILTGAIHLDGFVDTCDGLGGHRTAEDRWEVMHDSRAGAFGIVGVVLLLLVKYVVLNGIPGYLMMVTLVFMPVVSRWAMVYAIFAHRYARPSGLGKAVKQAASWPRFTVATFVTFIIALALIPLLHLAGLAVMLGVWAITVLVAVYLKSKFAGLTGDTYGAINEVAEVGALILIVLLAGLGLA